MRTAHEIAAEVTTTDPLAVKTVLDAYVRDSADPDEFCASMLARCRSNPDTIWELLSLIDQYERRGQAGRKDFQALKAALGREACGRPVPRPIPSGSGSPRAPEIGHVTVGNAIRLDPLTAAEQPAMPRPATGLGSVKQPQAPEVARIPAAGRVRVPQPGMVLRNRFVLEEVLGSGGMGKVYRAFDRNRLELPQDERYVAVKVLREDLAMRPEALDRLKREFHQTQRLSHPGIINVFDLDSDAALHFITMELLHGELLRDVMARVSPDCLDRSIAFNLLRDLGIALSYAHECGIVHADLKPGNVMITPEGKLRVLDFGLSMPLMREPWISTSCDSFQGVTRTYASCERLAGDSADVRDDIFSYACMAYELLAGRHPFSRSPANEARDEGVSLLRIPGLSGRQWRALRKGLAWKRVDRQETLAELVADLVPESFPRRQLPPHQWQAQQTSERSAGKWWTGGVLAVALLFVAGMNARDAPSFANMGADVSRSKSHLAGVLAGAGTAFERWRERFSATPDRPETADSERSAFEVQLDPANEEVIQQPAEVVAGTPVTSHAVVDSPEPASEVQATGRLEFSQATLQVSEASSVARLIVRRRGSIDRRASFSWRTVAGTATGDLDYAAFGTVSEEFAPGQTEVAVLVPIVRDAVSEGPETFEVEILESSGQARLGAVTRATVIVDDGDEDTVNRR